MTYAHKINGDWTEIVGGFVEGEGDEAIQHPPGWADNATPAQRTKAGVKAIAEAPDVPANVRFMGTRIVDSNGSPVLENIIEQFSPQEARDTMWARAKAYRENLIAAGAPTPKGKVNADIDGKVNLLGVALGGLISVSMQQPFSVSFTFLDNSVKVLNASEAMQTGMGALAYISAVHANSQAIRKALDTALANGSSAQTIFQIDITAGYPNA